MHALACVDSGKNSLTFGSLQSGRIQSSGFLNKSHSTQICVSMNIYVKFKSVYVSKSEIKEGRSLFSNTKGVFTQ